MPSLCFVWQPCHASVSLPAAAGQGFAEIIQHREIGNCCPRNVFEELDANGELLSTSVSARERLNPKVCIPHEGRRLAVADIEHICCRKNYIACRTG